MAARDQLLVGGSAAALLAAVLSAWLVLAPPMQTSAPGDPAGITFVGSVPPSTLASAEGGAALLVDVEGAVREPGVVELPTGARVGDAIAAAGGYADSADLTAAAASLNLAAPLDDGEQVYVPVTGIPTEGGPIPSSGSSGLVDLNTATPEQLDGLPGIGPVTVQKIVAAREERPFGTLEELVERRVLNNGQLDKVRDLVTV